MTYEFRLFLRAIVTVMLAPLCIVLFVPTLGHSERWLSYVYDEMTDWAEVNR